MEDMATETLTSATKTFLGATARKYLTSKLCGEEYGLEILKLQDIADKQIEPPLKIDGPVDIDFILGIGEIGEKVVMLLNVNKVLACSDVDLVSQISQKS